MRRASLAGLDTQAPGGSFVRRPSLSTLGSGKYKLAFDSYGDRERVIVRHVPIVIEGGEEDEEEEEEEKEVKVSASVSQSSSSVITDDLSSLSSLSSDNSMDTSRRKEGGGMEGSGYQSLDDWRRKRGRKHGVVEMGEHRQLRTPFKDIKQHAGMDHKTPVPKPYPRATPGPWYLLNTETVGMENCPVHGHGEGEGSKYRKDKKPGTMGHTYVQLRPPSLLQGRNEQTPARAGRPKHSVITTQAGKTEESVADMNIFERGPGQWSGRGIRSKTPSNTQKDEKEQMREPRKSDPTFQRRWSFRTPSVTLNKKSSDLPTSFQAPTLASLSRSLDDTIPEYFRGIGNTSEEKQETSTGKYPSESESQLNITSSSSLTAFNSIKTPSSSTSSIPPKISQSPDQMTKDDPLSTGILKTPGKRKVSSNNRVEFLNNIMEREIPGRHT